MLAEVIENLDTSVTLDSELYHHGIKGQHWGERRYQNKDGSLTPEGRQRYGIGQRAKDAANAIRKKIRPNKADLDEELSKAEHKRDLRAEKKQIKETNLAFRRKRIKKMTNDEIKDEIDRLALERDLKDMRESAKMSKGKEAFKNAIKDAANRTASNAIQTIGGALAEKIANSVAGNYQYKLAEREARLQLNYLDDKEKHAERRSKSGELLEDYYDLMGKHPKNGNRNGGKNNPSDIRRMREDAEDAMKLDILSGNEEAARRYAEYQKATGNGKGKNKSNNDDKPKDDTDNKDDKEIKKQLKKTEQQLKNAEQQRDEAREQTKAAEQERDAFKQYQHQEAQRRKRAEAIAKKNAQKAASEAKIAAEQKKKADGLVKAWAKHKYSERIENPDGSFTYIYGDDYQRYMATKMGLGKMS